jgi:hypothetical protein
LVWKAITAFFVLGPKAPSAAVPTFFCMYFTCAPLDPTFIVGRAGGAAGTAGGAAGASAPSC